MAHWLIIALQGVLHVMETVTFMQFIHEEAIQSAALGVFLAIRAKNYRAASLGITLLEGQLIPHLKEVNNVVGIFAPYSRECFKDFIDASEMNLEIYKDVLFGH